MTVVDGMILVLVLLMALQGYARGFIVGAMALVGFIAGAFLGTRIGPLLLSRGARSPYAPLFGLGGALIVGSLLGAVFEGVARRVRRFMWLPGLRIVDRLLGAVLTGCIGLGMAWIVGAVLLQAANEFSLPPSARQSIRRSAILRRLDSVLPPSGPVLNALARIDPLPSVNGRAADVPAPDVAILGERGVTDAKPSVVRIIGQACGFGVEGSGWVAAPGLVVTNAHVVAGERRTTVEPGGVGPGLPADAVLFDPHNDIAVLSVPGLREPALTLAPKPASGESAAILGYPLNGAFVAEPGRLGQTQTTATSNAYGNPTFRDISSLRGLVRPGNSGGPIVDAAGQVIGTVFAEITNPPAGKPGGFAVPNSVVGQELVKARAQRGTVSTQSCAD
ncbi:MAG TPA: MarP family serine protease [Solirubrobacteraceae bacterium]|jgi:S1-C subfamily serine protease|nr:MarP family serine protease [Solirubrobacteraceae bacterium]